MPRQTHASRRKPTLPSAETPVKRKPRAERVTGLRSVETLVHFQCGDCRKWWSIGDAPARNVWYCPWCGRQNRFAAAPERT
ncbi:hypothetical protein DB347_06735 [Opitutaceae bacterium EW11]|nr:hypothetical protein DB347_06735 [Opitutaceae bacterium EW11]